MAKPPKPIPSFQQFDYRIRTNKSAERRIFVEVFRRLSFFEPIENYRYIGFGSTTFIDFIQFHKTLNIRDMISIEKNSDYQPRFEFNKPFDCVELIFGESNEELPKLAWDKHTVAWLDYDGVLTGKVLEDITTVSMNANSGYMLIVTVNAKGYKSNPDEAYTEVEVRQKKQFKKQIDVEELPENIRGTNLVGDQMAFTCQQLILDCVEDTLRNRNGMKSTQNKIRFKALLNFIYKDGARMLTVGVLFYREGDKNVVNECKFENLDYVKEPEELVEIKVPVVTPKERQFLNERLPTGKSNEALEIGLLPEEINSYSRFYRYSPYFAEIELS